MTKYTQHVYEEKKKEGREGHVMSHDQDLCLIQKWEWTISPSLSPFLLVSRSLTARDHKKRR